MQIANSSGGDSFLEERYAKQISLLIDSAKSGTELRIDVSELLYKARKNKYEEQIVFHDEESSELSIKVRKKGGYTMKYLSSLEKFAFTMEGRDLIINF